MMTAMCVWVLSRIASGSTSIPRFVTVFVGLIGTAMLLGATPASLVSYLNGRALDVAFVDAKSARKDASLCPYQKVG